MENNDVDVKMLLAVLSQCTADRDKAVSNIHFILKNGSEKVEYNIDILKKEFEKISLTELTMEAVQTFFSIHYPNYNSDKKLKNDNDNIS